jgi:hypothetical protein
METDQRIRRANDARAILDNPTYQAAVAKFTQDIRALRLQLSPRDVEGASRLVMMEQAVEKAKRLMESYLQDGEAARKELEASVPVTPIGRMVAGFRRR